MLINFGLDSAELDTTARAELDEFAKALKDNRLSTLDFVVEGYTDASGSAHYNEGLSERQSAIGDSLPDVQRHRCLPASKRSAWVKRIRATPTRTIR